LSHCRRRVRVASSMAMTIACRGVTCFIAPHRAGGPVRRTHFDSVESPSPKRRGPGTTANVAERSDSAESRRVCRPAGGDYLVPKHGLQVLSAINAGVSDHPVFRSSRLRTLPASCRADQAQILGSADRHHACSAGLLLSGAARQASIAASVGRATGVETQEKT
jgi:hypothetical protein